MKDFGATKISRLREESRKAGGETTNRWLGYAATVASGPLRPAADAAMLAWSSSSTASAGPTAARARRRRRRLHICRRITL